MVQSDFLQVSEVMTRRPVVIRKGKTVTDAAILMKRYSVSSVLVMDDKQAVGIIAADDIVYRVTANMKRSAETLVDDIMSTDLITISPTATLDDAMRELNANDIRQLPVMQDGELVGFITLKDIIRIEPALMDLMAERVRNEEDARQSKIEKLASQEILDDDLFE
ncbi:CBS domain-containing protein [Candidatus Woesearchaeota archaeon]|nr:CBS domain-containing protein [Candidatus Woesearchaeota archaeon]